MLYAGDYKWWELYQENVKHRRWSAFAGERWTIADSARHRFQLNWIGGRLYPGQGLSPDLATLNTGGNSGFAALGMAHMFGAARVVLLGYDMQRTDQRSHWHGDHPAKLRAGRAPFGNWIKRFGKIAADLERVGVTVVNATRTTALQCFPRVSIEDALNGETHA